MYFFYFVQFFCNLYDVYVKKNKQTCGSVELECCVFELNKPQPKWLLSIHIHIIPIIIPSHPGQELTLGSSRTPPTTAAACQLLNSNCPLITRRF